MEFNLEGLEIQKLSIPTDKAQRVDDKIGSFVNLSCLILEL